MLVKFIDDAGALVQWDDGGLLFESVAWSSADGILTATVPLANGEFTYRSRRAAALTEAQHKQKVFEALRRENAHILRQRSKQAGAA